MYTRRLALALAVLAAALFSLPALACDCPGQTPAASLAAAAVVFEGEVISVGPSEYANQPCGGLCPDTAVRFRVARHWKGRPGREVVVLTDMGTDCGYGFTRGTTYVVYGSDAGGGRYHTSSCTRTAPIANAAEDLRALGRGTRVR